MKKKAFFTEAIFVLFPDNSHWHY